MDRISTAFTYQSALLGILNAQQRQTAAQQQISSGKVAEDLKGYGAKADTLTATRSLKSRLDSNILNAKALSSSLDVQDQALSQLESTGESARQAIADALTSGSADRLLTSLQGSLDEAVDGLNTQYQGRYLFAGGQISTPPVNQLSLSDLTAAPSTASLFKNDQQITTARIDDHLSVSTGFLASNLGQPLFDALKSVQALNDGPSGPLSGNLTTVQQTALQSILTTFTSAATGLTAAVANNGEIQSRVERMTTTLEDRQTALEGVLGDMTSVDMTDAIARLQLAQVATQASAQVFATLNNSSLLNVLSATN